MCDDGVGAGGGRSSVSRINDVGGMQGFPPIETELDEAPFHADWEAHVFAMNRALLGAGVYNLDEFRDAVERMPVQEYLAASYYERWFHAIGTLLVEKGVLNEADLDDQPDDHDLGDDANGHDANGHDHDHG
jgi:nitrile hydratase